MKRRIIAALMALCLCIGLLPATALAAGDIYEGNDTFYYHITDSSLANMVAAKRPEGSSSEVSRVTITFNEDYSAGEQNTFVFRNGYTIALSNVSDSVQPDDIAYLTISFVDGETIRIEQNELNWTWVSSLPRRYDLRLATDDNTCTVTFYYQPGDTVDNSAWQVYREVPVEKGTSLGNLMPALPNEGTAHWVAWETGSNNGTGAEFTADTIVNSDLTVYARKVTSGAGSEYHIMNPDNSLLEAVLELYLDDYPDSEVTTDDVQISRISVVGSEDSTNPNYSPVGTSYGWQEGTSWYWIYNLENHTLPEGGSYWNDRVPPNDIQSITIYATVDGNEETYSISRSELDVRVRSNVIIEIYLRDTNDEEEDTPPDAPDKDTVIDLAGKNAVAVKCTTNTDHQQDTSELSAESITVGSVVSNGEGGYTCTITVAPDSYVTAYNGTYSGHRLDPTGQTGEILLVHDGENWGIAGEAPYVTFTVSCGTDYAIDSFTKEFVDSTDEKDAATAAGINLGDYDFPNADGKVIIPNEEGATVTLLYAMTVTGNSGASFTVTDEGAELVEIDGVAITEGTDTDGNATFTGSIPADAASITFYVSKTFDADDLNGEVGNQVLTNEASITTTDEGGANPDNDEDTEETPAEEEQDMIPLDVYVYLRVEGSGQNGELTDEDLATIAEWELEKSNPDDYYILGKLSGVGLPEDILTDGELTYEKYATYIEQAFTGNKFKAYNDNENVNDLLKRINSWEKLSWAYGAPGYNVEGNCLHLDGVLKLKSSYDLTYDANGGTINGKDTFVVNGIVPADPTNYELGKDTGYTAPTHVSVDDKTVLFAGWTTDGSAQDQIYRVEDAKNGSVPAAVDAVDLIETKTVYALWSYDEDNDGTPDINEIIVTPADITIYTGGDSYTGEIVDSKGDPVTSGGEDETQDYNGFPEPGFYITLPTALNDQLRGGTTGPVDLSEELSFVYSVEGQQEKTWNLQMYNPKSSSNIAFSKFVYRMTPAEGQAPVRLQIAGEDGPISDDRLENFGTDNLFETYTMSIYGGDVRTDAVKAQLTINGAIQSCDIYVDSGELTVRGTTASADTVAVNAPLDDANGFQATAESENKYYINGSNIEVAARDVHLLTDELTGGQEQLNQLQEKAEDALTTAGITETDGLTYDFMYLDLVDSSNGNAYVTMQGTHTVTIHWPIPTDADPDGKFYVVHFGGLDRNYTITDGNIPIDDEKIDVYHSGDEDQKLNVNTDVGSVSFKTSTFSPFALVYEQTSTPTEQVTVTFKVDNGTWSDGSSRNIVYTINKGTTLASNSIAVPTGMRPESGYTGGSWDTEPNTTTTLTGNVIYTYRFTRSGGGSESKPYLRFDSNGGTEFEPIDENGRDFSINVYHDEKYGDHIPTRPGYRFTGWYTTNTLQTRIDEDEILRVTSYRTVFAGWEETSVPSMLNGDDHYAYIQGYSDGTVRPNANITRAQVATIFFRLLDEDVRDDNLTTYNTFPDVDEDYWANTAISTMASLGVINGRNSGLFDPDAYITRAEFAAICARFDDSGVDGITTFTDTVGHWAEDEISRAAALGWIQGYSDGTFRPNQYITRAQAVTMINRVLCRLPEDTDDLLSGMNTWTDCHEDDWFYLAIQEATNSHDFVAKDRVYESWTDLNRAPDWSRYE